MLEVAKQTRELLASISGNNKQLIRWFEAIQENAGEVPSAIDGIVESIALINAEIDSVQIELDAFELQAAVMQAEIDALEDSVSSLDVNTQAQVTANLALGLVRKIGARFNPIIQSGKQITPVARILQPSKEVKESVFQLLSPFSSTSTTLALITGWTFRVNAGSVYRITVIGAYQTDTITTGGELGVIGVSSAAGTIVGSFDGAIDNTAAATNREKPLSAISGTGASMVTPSVAVINTPHFFNLDAAFTCTTSGSIEIRWASDVAASAAQLNAGSILIVKQLI